MGTMVGDDGAGNQIGVAPGRRWIAAKGCEFNSCSDTALLSSGQWMLAPTDLNGQNPRPDLAPARRQQLVGRRPGSTRGTSDMVTAWMAAGIFPLFSNGNAGPACDTSGSPATTSRPTASAPSTSTTPSPSFSSRGPSAIDGEHQAQHLRAGRQRALAASPATATAPSAARRWPSPHVAGTVALMWSAAPGLVGDIDATKALLDETARDVRRPAAAAAPSTTTTSGARAILDAFAGGRAARRGRQPGPSRARSPTRPPATPIAGAKVSVTGRSTAPSPPMRTASTRHRCRSGRTTSPSAPTATPSRPSPSR